MRAIFHCMINFSHGYKWNGIFVIPTAVCHGMQLWRSSTREPSMFASTVKQQQQNLSRLWYQICIMMTSLSGNAFLVTSPLWGESTGHRWTSLTKGQQRRRWCFLWCKFHKRLNKQSSRRWFDTPGCSLWRHSKYICILLRLETCTGWLSVGL